MINNARKLFNNHKGVNLFLKLSGTATLLYNIKIHIKIIIIHIIRIAKKYCAKTPTQINIQKYDKKNTGQIGHNKVNKLQNPAAQVNIHTQILCFLIVEYNHTNIPNSIERNIIYIKSYGRRSHINETV